jgi:uroporphyrinogen decarboxylase
MGLFTTRIKTENKTQVPVWFMRQAGRYHSHYQNIKKDSDFMTMCKNPKLAQDVTMGPIEDFKFDAAILFSDLLFPLEHLNLGLSYHSGPPTLERHLTDENIFATLKPKTDASVFYNFQGEAIKLLKKSLPSHVSMLGFVGAPFTLYTYATEGSHSGGLIESKKGLYNGRYSKFCELLLPTLLAEMQVQARAGADAICLFDTAVGELCLSDFKEFIVPRLQELLETFKKSHPDTKIVYYSKLTHLDYLRTLGHLPIDVLGVDWRMNLAAVLKEFGDRFYIQGNIDPVWLHLPWSDLEKNLAGFIKNLKDENVRLDKWICGLGHGVLQKTPEENVRKTVEYIHKNFTY